MISRFYIDRPRFAFVISIVILIAGIIAALARVRQAADALEGVLEDQSWPLPKYREMLFVY